MNYILTAATAVSKEAGSMSEMLPKFGVIALVVVNKIRVSSLNE